MDKIHNSWKPLFDQYDFDLDSIYDESVPVYPPVNQVFAAFEMPVDSIKLVFLGQDPYHGPNQAHGLAFSVANGVAPPPSLQNIFKELRSEFADRVYKFATGNLTAWTTQGIFLLNTSLTVKQAQPNSHSDIWQGFTDDVIQYIATHNPQCIFLLLGNNAKAKARFISDSKRIITGVHPSPLSAHRGFFGSNIFKKVETALGHTINWET